MKGKGSTKKPKAKVAHTLPASFYQNYVPPATPKINPQTAKMKVPEIESLPKTSPNKQPFAPSSLKDSQYPMSMPAHRGLAYGPNSTNSPFGFKTNVPFSSGGDKKADPQIIEEEDGKKDESISNSLVEATNKLKVGSFTCFDVMSGPPASSKSDSLDNKDAASATSQQTASTFASAEENDVAPEPSDDDDEEDLFEMDM